VADSRVDELRRRLERDPGSRLFAQLAEELRKAGQVEEAISVARAGLEQHPSYASARLTLGRALLDSGDPGGARAELETAVREAPDNILASRLLGEALETLGDLGEALVRYGTTLEMAPGDGHVESRVRAIQERLGGGGPPEPEGHPPEITKPMPAVTRGPVDGVSAGGGAKVPPPLPPTVRLPAAPQPASAPRAPLPPTEGRRQAAPERGAGEATGHAAGALAGSMAAPSDGPGVSGGDRALPPTLPLGARARSEPAPGPADPQSTTRGGGEALPSVETPGGDDTGQAPLSSATLAELYLQQGLRERAVEVYRQVLDEEPGNEAVGRRLAEIESLVGGSRAGRTDGGTDGGDERSRRRHALEAAIDRLEALLLVVRRR